MDLRNYGVIDFAEHVVLPSGDADDLHDLTHENVEVGAWYSNGKKAQKIAELQEKIDHTERLLKARTAELAESNKIIVNIEAKLKKAGDNAAKANDLRVDNDELQQQNTCLLYTSPSPRDGLLSRMPSSA